jgi:hypothetical protein
MTVPVLMLSPYTDARHIYTCSKPDHTALLHRSRSIPILLAQTNRSYHPLTTPPCIPLHESGSEDTQRGGRVGIFGSIPPTVLFADRVRNMHIPRSTLVEQSSF